MTPEQNDDRSSSSSELLALATSVATEAAELVLSKVGAVRSTTTKSSSSDLVTEVDKASEALIVSRIQDQRPDDGFVGEEGTDIEGSSGVRWVIDPIDGTTSFVYGYPGFSVSVAAELDGVTVAATVIEPLRQLATYTATLDGGAHLNAERIQVNNQNDLLASVLATGFSYFPDKRRHQAEVLVDLLPRISNLRRSGSAALDLCHVAAGLVDGYFELGLNPWDVGAGALIAAEAGAIVRFEGDPSTGDMFTMAAAPGIAEELLARLTAAGGTAYP